jgi:hypothetical protein
MKMTMRGSGRGVAGALLTLLLTTAAFAEGPAINGYVDTQYIYNFDNPMGMTNAFRSYDAQDNNITSTAHLALTGKMSDEASYVVEVDAGNDADFTTGTAGEDVTLQEGYLVYTSGSGLGFKAGKFATFEGIEVIESVANPTISRGFLFGLAEPFTHVGGVLTYVMGKIDVAAGAVNGWDQQDDVNNGKTLVAKVGVNLGDPLTFTVSGLHGPETGDVSDDPTTPLVDESDERNGDNRSSIDLTGVTKIIPKVALWFQANAGSESRVLDKDGDGLADDRGNWQGFTIQPVVEISEKFSIGARYEYFDDEGSRTLTLDPMSGGPQHIVLRNISICPAFKLTDSVTVRGEVRIDDSNKKVFTDDKGMPEDSNTTGSLQLALTF